jgi:hypothetical protein
MGIDINVSLTDNSTITLKAKMVASLCYLYNNENKATPFTKTLITNVQKGSRNFPNT